MNAVYKLCVILFLINLGQFRTSYIIYPQQMEQLQVRISELSLKQDIIDAGFTKQQSINYNRHEMYTQLQQQLNKINESIPKLKLPKLTYEELEVSKGMQFHCHIQFISNYFIFQTPRAPYLVANNQDNSFSIYGLDCKLISHVKQSQVYKVLCDRNLCDDGNVIIISTAKFVILCSEGSNFTDCTTISNLQERLGGQLVGGAVRGRGNGQLQIYVADQRGQIIVLDNQGKLRLTVSMEQDSKIKHFLDLHSHPIAISDRGWIYIFDNSKYTLSLTRCPYLFQSIDHAFVSHPYSSTVFILSASIITSLQLKIQSKNCELRDRFTLINQLTELQTPKSFNIAEYQGVIYIGNKIINMVNKTVHVLPSCSSFSGFNFQQMKNNHRRGFFTLACGNTNNNLSSLMVFKQTSNDQLRDKSNTAVMIGILLLVVLLIFLFLRSTVPNLDYDEQLKYNQNMSYRAEVAQNLQPEQEQQPAELKKNYKTRMENSHNQRNSTKKSD